MMTELMAKCVPLPASQNSYDYFTYFITAQLFDASQFQQQMTQCHSLIENGVFIIRIMASQSTSGKISDLYELKEELGK